MRTSRTVVRLSWLIAALALVAAGVGLFWQGGDGPFAFTTHRGQTVEIYGRGLYRADPTFTGAGARGTDAVTLVLGVPLLIAATLRYRLGSPRGGLLLMGALSWFLYAYASAALGTVAYNDLFLVYVALFSASLVALALAFRSFEARSLPAIFSNHPPRRGPAALMFASGVLLLAVWLLDPVAALFRDEPPESLRTQTTLFTNALDMAVIVPLVVLAGALILRRDPQGYLIALPLLVFEAMLAPMIAAQTVSQLAAGWSFTTGEIVGPISGFVVLALIAVRVIVGVLRNVADGVPAAAARPRGTTIDSPATA